MSLVCEDDVSLSEIDEAISHARASLKIDIAGNRMNWRKKELLLSSIDDLLDMRLDKMREISDLI